MKSNFRWQFYWTKWHLDYSREYYMGFEHVGMYNFYVQYLIIGPLQMSWYSSE